MSLHQLLKKISEGKAINLKLLLQKLPKGFDWQTCFVVEMVGNERYTVQVTDETVFNTLLLSSVPAKNRQSAAGHVLQSSHDVGCDSAFMLCFPNIDLKKVNLSHRRKSAPINANVKCLYAVQNQLTFTHKPADIAILIENQDCFFHWQRMLHHFDLAPIHSNIDIYFSAGKQVLNSKFAALWPHYKNVYCLFDYDLEGLKIYRTLSTRHANKFCYFVPESCQPSLFKLEPKSMQDLAEAISLANHLNLSSLADCLSHSKCFMEQEALLL